MADPTQNARMSCGRLRAVNLLDSPVASTTRAPMRYGIAMTTRHRALWQSQLLAVTTSPGKLAPATRQAIMASAPQPAAALEHLLDKVRHASPTIVRADVDAAVDASGDQDVVFEAVLAAALGAADQRLRAGLAAAGIREG